VICVSAVIVLFLQIYVFILWFNKKVLFLYKINTMDTNVIIGLSVVAFLIGATLIAWFTDKSRKK
jgi:hypothetical protein